MRSALYLVAAFVASLPAGPTHAQENYSYEISMNGRYGYSFAFEADRVLTKGWGPESACQQADMVGKYCLCRRSLGRWSPLDKTLHRLPTITLPIVGARKRPRRSPSWRPR